VGHRRVTGAVRLLLAVWLMVAAGQALSDPQRATAELRAPIEAVLLLAALWFTFGVFLATGFMTRVVGVLMLGLSIYQSVAFGATGLAVLMAVLGVYFALRGGGAWAMDVYVQKMQDRVRRREAAAASAEPVSELRQS
jgi:hypothetical protein